MVPKVGRAKDAVNNILLLFLDRPAASPHCVSSRSRPNFRKESTSIARFREEPNRGASSAADATTEYRRPRTLARRTPSVLPPNKHILFIDRIAGSRFHLPQLRRIVTLQPLRVHPQILACRNVSVHILRLCRPLNVAR